MRKTPLHDWISEKIFGRAGHELTADHIRRYQLERLQGVVDYVLEKSPFYQSLLRGTSGKDLHGLDDLSALPMTTVDDVRQSGPRFLCVSQSEVERVVTLQIPDVATNPRRLYFSRSDLELTIDFFHHGMTTLVQPGRRVLILMPGDRPGSVGDLLAEALARAGVLGFIHGVVHDPAATIDAIVEKGIDCLVGIPTQVLALARHERADRIPSGMIENVLLSADYVPSSLVNELQRVWDCKVFGHYGSTEMGLGGGVECEALSGYHLREADLLFEVVDSASGRLIPDGHIGEVVFTTLSRSAMPLIRYRTGDLSRFLTDPCPCGTVLRRLEKIRGKVGETVSLRSGDWLSIADLDEALFALPGIVNYRASLIKSDDVDRLELVIHEGSHKQQNQRESILGAITGVPAISHALETGQLVLEQIRFSAEDPPTTGVAKRTIVQGLEKQ